jgi:hypothetical protein
MHKKSMWWYFLLAFTLMIGSIQSLGWWTRSASAQSEASPSPTPASARVLHHQPSHWRDPLMHR